MATSDLPQIIVDCEQFSVAAMLINPDGRYLMQLREDLPHVAYPGHWGLFGGMIENEETPEESMRRELLEELNFEPGEISYFTQLAGTLASSVLDCAVVLFFPFPSILMI